MKLARTIAGDMPEPKSLAATWKDMINTWKRQQIDPGYQFDLPLPSTAAPASGIASGATTSQKDDEAALEQSIGELAPDGL